MDPLEVLRKLSEEQDTRLAEVAREAIAMDDRGESFSGVDLHGLTGHLRNIYPSQGHARPPKYVTDPQNWEYDESNFDGRLRAQVPTDGSEPEKFVDLPDPSKSVVWVTAEWTEERSGGGPDKLFASFLDAVESFDEDGDIYYHWRKSHGEWFPRLMWSSDRGRYIEPDESCGLPRVIPMRIIPPTPRTTTVDGRSTLEGLDSTDTDIQNAG